MGFAAAILACLVTTCLMGEAHARYSCSTDSDCAYEGCNDIPCYYPYTNGDCINGLMNYGCSRSYCYENGYYYTGNACPVPAPCAAGKYSLDGTNAAGSKACQDCPAGKYQPATGSTVCTDCGPGKTAPAGSDAEGDCVACAAGKYAPAGSGATFLDMAGTYVPAGSAVCLDCAAGKTAPAGSDDVVDCVACDAGKYAPAGSACIDCAAGTYLPSTGATRSLDCIQCETGKYEAAEGSSACSDCASGKTAPSGSDDVGDCVACVAGKYAPEGSACIDCAAGKYEAAEGSSACSDCAAGKYSIPGSATCNPRCGLGFYSTTSGESSFFSDTCLPCPSNSESPVGSSSISDCKCSTGFFGSDGNPCHPCPTGSFKAEIGAADGCTACPKKDQWSPTQSVSSDDCMVIPKPKVSEKCPQPRIVHFGEPQYAKCILPWEWTHLFNGYKENTINWRQGGLGRLRVKGRFETWVCIKGHPCASDLTDDHFCFVWEQVEKKFIPWGPNSALNLLHPPVTQDEILHLRAEIKELKEWKEQVAQGSH